MEADGPGDQQMHRTRYYFSYGWGVGGVYKETPGIAASGKHSVLYNEDLGIPTATSIK